MFKIFLTVLRKTLLHYVLILRTFAGNEATKQLLRYCVLSGTYHYI